ncbi:hypothetical protein LMG26690_01337 [Achromobacter animicus]|uniref:SGNH/GDSL hydrolase family protein n=1 Tax=Achromobacter animicus TaxID=1389935 RepID=A0A6S6ZIK1_9BURK|nr:hypothetical protein [Achromobacter animicus]CAB3676136.1 hypothetical protein LMG26690_01337 [Achromobacter animicus]
MKLCVIGNSHASGAYSLLSHGTGAFEADFFLERATGKASLKIAGEVGAAVEIDDVMMARLVPVRTQKYDAFAVYAMGFSFGRCVEMFRDYAPDGHPNSKAKYLVSDAFFDAAVQSILLDSKAVRIVRALRSFSNAPIVLVPQPLPMEWAATRSLRRTEVFADALRQNALQRVLRIYSETVERLRGDGFTVLGQPTETLASEHFTLSEFGLADPNDNRADSLFSRGDFFHANERYAGAVLTSLATALRV